MRMIISQDKRYAVNVSGISALETHWKPEEPGIIFVITPECESGYLIGIYKDPLMRGTIFEYLVDYMSEYCIPPLTLEMPDDDPEVVRAWTDMLDNEWGRAGAPDEGAEG